MTSPDEGRALLAAASVEPAGPGRYCAELSPHYTIVGHPHGGYLQCVIASAALAGASEAGATHQHVTAISTNYVNAPEIGPAELRVDVRRTGRGVTFLAVGLEQHGELITESLVTLGTLQEGSRVRYHGAAAPEMPSLELSRSMVGGDEVGIRNVLELRLDPAVTGWWDGQLSTQGEIRGWIRLDDGEASWSPWSLLFATDAFPPATLPLGSSGWVPTLQLTSYVRRVPTSEWLRGVQRAIVIADGLVDERCELFDDSGQLVASSTQLALVRLPGGR